MSIVEKAVDKLAAERAAQADEEAPQARVTGPERIAKTHVQSTAGASVIERLGERVRSVSPPALQKPRVHVDFARIRRAGLLPPDAETANRLGEELRRIKLPLLLNISGKRAHGQEHRARIMVASALPGEGKSFTALNLALSLAKGRDLDVLLVDGDIPKSDITVAFGLEAHRGLMDILMDEDARAEEAVLATDVQKLAVLPAGTGDARAMEWFTSQRMERVLQELDGLTEQRIVVFDSPPLMAVTEARVLASHVGQVIMVVAAGRTSQQVVRSALELMDGRQDVGLVLNMSRLPAHENYYYRFYSKDA